MAVTAARGLRWRIVRLVVQNLPTLPDYHGREAGLIGEAVDAVEVVNEYAVAFIDNRDGEAAMLAEAVDHARRAGVLDSKYERDLEAHAKSRFLHGVVIGVRR